MSRGCDSYCIARDYISIINDGRCYYYKMQRKRCNVNYKTGHRTHCGRPAVTGKLGEKEDSLEIWQNLSLSEK